MADSDFIAAIERQIEKWQLAQTNVKLRDWKIHVEHLDGETISAAIFCKNCHSKIDVGVGPNGHTVNITRWIYHVKMCHPERSRPHLIQLTMRNFHKPSCRQENPLSATLPNPSSVTDVPAGEPSS